MAEPERRSLPPSYFEDLYGARDDPWDFETSPYERDKYAATLGALPRARLARRRLAGRRAPSLWYPGGAVDGGGEMTAVATDWAERWLGGF